MLVSAGASVDDRNPDGSSALEHAWGEMLDALLKLKPGHETIIDAIGARMSSSLTGAPAAVEEDHALWQLLPVAGELDASTRTGAPLLTLGCVYRRTDFVERLLSRTPDPAAALMRCVDYRCASDVRPFGWGYFYSVIFPVGWTALDCVEVWHDMIGSRREPYLEVESRYNADRLAVWDEVLGRHRELLLARGTPKTCVGG